MVEAVAHGLEEVHVRDDGSGLRNSHRECCFATAVTVDPRGQVRGGEGSAVRYQEQGWRLLHTSAGRTTQLVGHRSIGQAARCSVARCLKSRAGPDPPTSSDRLETGRMKGHRSEHGCNPKHNKTNDGSITPACLSSRRVNYDLAK